jgi:hypothetical protein
MNTLILAIYLALHPCGMGQYLSIDGRCLHDQTGERHPAGDGCNTITCMDPACRYGATTAVVCLHGDDPAILVPSIPKARIHAAIAHADAKESE